MIGKRVRRGGKIIVVLTGGLLGLVLGYIGFQILPERVGVEPLQVGLVALFTVVGLIISSRIADNLFLSYNVAEVGVDGPILRDGFPFSSSSDVTVQLLEDAQAADGLILRVNSPGGNIVPSDDIRKQVQEFEGPTVAYVTDVCASGGYWIASACDHIVARETSLVGSIGVIGSKINAKELADKIGISYERLAAGEYKDAGNPLKEISEKEKKYLQGIIDDFYEIFVSKVAESRELDEEDIKNTEARVFLGKKATEIGLIDETGTKETAEEKLEQELGEKVTVKELEPRGLKKKFKRGANQLAYSFGAGVAEKFSWKDFEFKI